MASDEAYKGSMIKLISKSLIRYEGCLEKIDSEESTVTLTKVRSFGSEGRRADVFIPPSDHIYPCIVFRGPDIAELDVLHKKDEVPTELQLQDPAIVSMQQQTQPAAPTPAAVPATQRAPARVPAPTRATQAPAPHSSAAVPQRMPRKKPTPIGSAAPGSSVQKSSVSKSSKASPHPTAWGNSASKASAPPTRKAWDSNNSTVINPRANTKNPIGTKWQTQTNTSRGGPVGTRGGRQSAPTRSAPVRRVPAAASKSSTASRPSAWGAASKSQQSKKWSGPGMGSHLMGGKKATPKKDSTFDFEAMLAKGLRAKLKEAAQVQTVAVYTGDSFFDNLSTDTTGRANFARGPQFRKEQNDQNMETFGQVRLNRSQRRRYQHRGNNGPRRRPQPQRGQPNRQNRGQMSRGQQNKRQNTSRPPRRYYRTDRSQKP